ncbi:MAG: hypothetical protein U0929_12000 [Planctomycetaceae bacterium]
MPLAENDLCQMALALVQKHGYSVSHIQSFSKLHPEVAALFDITTDDKLAVRFGYTIEPFTPEEIQSICEGLSPEDRENFLSLNLDDFVKNLDKMLYTVVDQEGVTILPSKERLLF